MIYQPDSEIMRIMAVSDLIKSVDLSKMDIIERTECAILMIEMIKENVRKSLKIRGI